MSVLEGDPVMEAFDRMTCDATVLSCGCSAWRPRSVDCQHCPQFLAHVEAAAVKGR